MLSFYRLVTFLVCLATTVAGILYSLIALTTLTRYENPATVALTALFLLLLCVLVLPSLLGAAFGVDISNTESGDEDDDN